SSVTLTCAEVRRVTKTTRVGDLRAFESIPATKSFGSVIGTAPPSRRREPVQPRAFLARFAGRRGRHLCECARNALRQKGSRPGAESCSAARKSAAKHWRSPHFRPASGSEPYCPSLGQQKQY